MVARGTSVSVAPHPLIWSCLHVTYAQLHRETETDVPLNASVACHVWLQFFLLGDHLKIPLQQWQGHKENQSSGHHSPLFFKTNSSKSDRKLVTTTRGGVGV